MRGFAASIIDSPRFPVKLILFLFVFIAHFSSGFDGTGDSRWSIHTALSIVREGNTDLDEYADIVQRNGFYATRVYNGHIYNWYPMGASLLALPVVWIVDKSLGRMGIDLNEKAKGGLLGGVEVLAASLIVALTAVFIYLMAMELTVSRRGLSLLAALLFAFGTSAWSTSSRALWMHGPSALMISMALYYVVASKRRPALIQYAGLPLAFSFVVRPTNALAIIIFTLYVLLAQRRWFLRFAFWALVIAVPFFVFNVTVLGKPLPLYYSDQTLGRQNDRLIVPVGGHFENTGGRRVFVPVEKEFVIQRELRFFEALAGHIASPSRGLFIFSPFLLFAIWGIFIKLGKNPIAPNLARDRLDYMLIALLVLHWVLISSFTTWWGGWSFGPRYFTDVIPVFFYFLVPAMIAIPNLRSPWRQVVIGIFIILAAVSVFANFRGATSAVAQWGWNSSPVDIDSSLNRLWDYGDIQFLRGLGGR